MKVRKRETMIHVVNRKNYRGASVYVGRPGVLGNPFVIGRDGDRAEVIEQYRRWLWNELQRGAGQVWEEMQRLSKLAEAADLVLSCWCHPLPCHGEVIRAAITWCDSQTQPQKECNCE